MATSKDPKADITELADVTPLSTADILELDYDDDNVPTRVDGRSHSEPPSMFPPPRVDQNDVFMLMDAKRPSLMVVNESDEVIDFNDVLRAPPRLPDFSMGPLPTPSLPPRRRTESMSSIAPVAMSAGDTGKLQRAPERTSSRSMYGLGLGFLAGIALAIAVWPSNDAAPVATNAAPPIQTRETVVVASDQQQPVIHVLDTVEIVGSASNSLSPKLDEVKSVVPENRAVSPASAPVENVTTAPPEEAVDTEELAPPEPPPADLPAFDRATANAGLNAAAGAASSCRTDGSPRLPGRVSVTFAPNGRVTTAVVDGATFAGSTVGGCIARTFRSVRIEPFAGSHITVHKTYTF